LARFLICVLLVPAAALPIVGQSGRGRPKTAPPARTEAPLPVRVPASAAVLAKEQRGVTSRFLLKNKLAVLISEKHSSPAAAVVTCFKASRAAELIPGASDLVGRLLTNRMAARARSLGGILTCQTLDDMTCYQLIVPANKVKEALALEADTMRGDFSAEEITRASIEPAPQIAPEQVAKFHRLHYRPDKAIVAAVGAVDTFEVLTEAQSLYGNFKGDLGAELPSDGSAKPTPPISYINERGSISQTVVTLKWRAPGLRSEEWPALQVLAVLMGQGRACRLSLSLLYEQNLVRRIQSEYQPMIDGGSILVRAWLDPQLIDKAESALFREIDRLRREPPLAGELARAKSMAEAQFTSQYGDLLGRALWLVRSEAATSGLKLALGYRDQINSVSAEQVRRAAAKYLTLDGLSVHEFEPLSAPPRTFDASSFAQTIAAWAPGFARQVDAAIAPQQNSLLATVVEQGKGRSQEEQELMESLRPLPIRDFSTLSGARAFVLEDHSRPEVAIAVLFQGMEQKGAEGLRALALISMLYGTARRMADEVALELEQLGARIELVLEPDHFGFVMNVLSRNSERALKLLSDLIEGPAFRDQDVERARAELIGLMGELADSELERSRQLVLESMFAWSQYGSREAIWAVKGEQLRAWHAQTIKRQRPLIVIVGDTEGSALVSAVVAGRFSRREVDRELNVKLEALRPGQRIERRRLARSFIAIGFPGPKFGSDDLAALKLIEAMASGGGLAGSAQMRVEAWSSAGLISFQMIAPPQGEDRLRAALAGELERMARGQISQDELSAAKAMALALRSSQKPSEKALEYARAALYQKPPQIVDELAERVSEVAPEDIKRVASTYFKPSSAFVGVVAP
jgi:zinc protease